MDRRRNRKNKVPFSNLFGIVKRNKNQLFDYITTERAQLAGFPMLPMPLGFLFPIWSLQKSL